jgi:hypothetical protein
VDAGRASLGSDAASSMQQPQTLREREVEAQLQMLKAKIEATAKIAAQPLDLSPHQSYPEWDPTSHTNPNSAPLHAALSRAEAAEAELRTLKAFLAEPDDALQQHFAQWQKLDGLLQSLRKMGDKALRKEFNAFSDVKKEAFFFFRGIYRCHGRRSWEQRTQSTTHLQARFS